MQSQDRSCSPSPPAVSSAQHGGQNARQPVALAVQQREQHLYSGPSDPVGEGRAALAESVAQLAATGSGAEASADEDRGLRLSSSPCRVRTPVLARLHAYCHWQSRCAVCRSHTGACLCQNEQGLFASEGAPPDACCICDRCSRDGLRTPRAPMLSVVNPTCQRLGFNYF